MAGQAAPECQVGKRSANPTVMTATPLGKGPGEQRPREGVRLEVQGPDSQKHLDRGGTLERGTCVAVQGGRGALASGPGARRPSLCQVLPSLPPQSSP